MIDTLQSLRFIFVMLIFMSHFSYREIQPLDAGGDCGVAFFFLLSGFVLSLGYGRQIRERAFDYQRFLKRRLLKFYPLHLLCLLFVIIVGRPALDWKVLLNVFLLQSWVPTPDCYFACNSVSWFLSSIVFCYVVFPWAYRHVSCGWLTVVIVAYVAVYLFTPYNQVNAILYVNPLVRFVDFYFGLVLCRLYERQQLLKTGRWELLLIALLIIALIIYPMTDEKLRNAPLYWFVLIPLILVFAQKQGPVSRWLQTKPMLFLGSLTMPIFLTHQMLIGILLRRLPEMPVVWMLTACILIIILISWAIQVIFSCVFRL